MTDIALEPDAGSGHRIHFESRPNAALAARAAGVPVLDVVVPVYNEQAALADSVYRLHRHLRENFPFAARITIADNASVDDTPRIAAELAAELSDVRVVRLEQKGRGRALHAVWSTSDAPVLAYMDVDLSTDLAALAPLVAPLDLRSLGPGDRHPAGPWRARGARAEAGDHLALLQPDPEIDTRRALFRRAVRLQGHPRRRRRTPAPARRRHRMVLRHRAAGARGAQRPAHPRSPCGLGRRPGQPRRHRRHRDRRPQGHRADAAWLRRRLDPGEHHCRAAGFIAAGGRTWVAVPPGGAVRRHRRRVDRGLPAAVPA